MKLRLRLKLYFKDQGRIISTFFIGIAILKTALYATERTKKKSEDNCNTQKRIMMTLSLLLLASLSHVGALSLLVNKQ